MAPDWRRYGAGVFMAAIALSPHFTGKVKVIRLELWL